MHAPSRNVACIGCGNPRVGNGYFSTEMSLETAEDGEEHVVNSVKDFVIVIVKRHLQIQTSELSQMTMSVRVLSTEH